jgi:DNA-binding NarL/FixJ family response regulator
LIADDHPIFRDGLRALLNTVPDFQVVGEASDSESVIRLVQEVKPDILLLDWALSRLDKMSILREIEASGLQVRTLLIGVVLDKADILQALQLGAWGVVLGNSTTRMLIEGIRTVMEGQYWIGQESVTSLVEALRDFGMPAHNHGPRRDFELTPRELEIIDTIVAGYSNADIAVNFSLSEHTVKHHITHIFDKLGVSNRLELALFAVNHQLTGETR